MSQANGLFRPWSLLVAKSTGFGGQQSQVPVLPFAHLLRSLWQVNTSDPPEEIQGVNIIPTSRACCEDYMP